MKTGRTIGARRERVESESERTRHREKQKRRKLISVATYLTVVGLVVLGIYLAIAGFRKQGTTEVSEETVASAVSPTVEILDEAGVGVSRRVKEFVGYLEEDLAEYGLRLERAVLPRDKTREVDVYLEGFSGYFKLSIDRGAGVSAEDVERMVRYLRERGFSGAEYVDLRVEGKGYYRGAVEGE